MSQDPHLNLVHEAQEIPMTPVAPASKPAASQFMVRVEAYVHDMVASACAPMDTTLWKKQGLTMKDAGERPPAVAFKYHGCNAVRAVFDKTVRVSEGKKVKELDGVWLRTGSIAVDAGGGKRTTQDIPLDAPQPLLPGLAKRANADTSLPLHITDREDVAIALAASGAAVIGVASGATLFANPESVDAHAMHLPRPLHRACAALDLGARGVVFIFDERTTAVTIARGLRQGEAHTGSVQYVRTTEFLSLIDSAISQGETLDALHTRTLEAAATYEEDLLPAILSGDPGSVGMRVPLNMLQCLPAGIRDLMWPAPEGGGTSWDNLDWGLTRSGAVNGLFRDMKGDEFTLNKPALTLHTPIYVSRRATMAEGAGEDHVELTWAEQTADGYRRKVMVLPSAHVFGGAGRELLRAGVPIADARRASQWFNAFRAANPALPTYQLHDQAGWISTETGKQFLLPGADIPGHALKQGVLSGVVREGVRARHWKYTQDFYNACDPLNQILLVAPHASLLLAALRMPGCVLGLVDESSSGKSVFLQTTARQYGWEGGDYAYDASNPPTAAFLERLVYRHNGLCVLIDEFHKLPNTRREAHGNAYTREEAAYFLSNGQRRGRSNATGGIDSTQERVYCYAIVAGEKKYITALDRASQMDGARVRMITLPLLGYKPSFKTAYGGLPGFMDRIKSVKGHIGTEVAEALAQALNATSDDDMRAEVGMVTAQLKTLFGTYKADDNVSQRRATFLAPILYTEMLLGRAFPDSGMWSASFDDTCIVRALAGAHRDKLMCLDTRTSDTADEVSASSTILEALRRDPTLIQGFVDEEGKTNPYPLARLMQRKRAGTSGLQLYPKAVMQMLRRNGIPDSSARDLLKDSGDFLLQDSADEGPRLLHRSNGAQWIVPMAGWGWDILLAAPGDATAALKDPYHEPRQAFLRTFEEELQGASEDVALLQAIDRHLEYLRRRHGERPIPGTLQSQLLLGYEPAWRALVDPLVERLSEKESLQDLTEVWYPHVQKRTTPAA